MTSRAPFVRIQARGKGIEVHLMRPFRPASACKRFISADFFLCEFCTLIDPQLVKGKDFYSLARFYIVYNYKLIIYVFVRLKITILMGFGSPLMVYDPLKAVYC